GSSQTTSPGVAEEAKGSRDAGGEAAAGRGAATAATANSRAASRRERGQHIPSDGPHRKREISRSVPHTQENGADSEKGQQLVEDERVVTQHLTHVRQT